MSSFRIIQGGMGVGVSSWQLARTVSALGQLGVVSGTGLSTVMVRRLENGDPGGHVRRALGHFPIPAIADRILERYFIEGGRNPAAAYALTPMPQLQMSSAGVELLVASNFAEVFLAKEGHGGLVGVNYLEKIQLALLPSIYGAMLAGVDYVLIGAGIPRQVPGVLDSFSRGEIATYRIDVEGAHPGEEFVNSFSPAELWNGKAPGLHRPRFLAIVSSATLAMTLARKSNGAVDGFIVEGKTAGGHNAPPRGASVLNDRGEPVYGPRDDADLEKIRALDLPFYLAGGFGRPAKLAAALAVGAAGIQVGTAFAFCQESGITPELKRQVLAMSRQQTADVLTDPAASPTGFPLKVMQLPGTLSDLELFRQRPRNCDIGYLRKPYRKEDGTLGYRCAAEPVDQYVAKGGKPEDTVGRKCLCNALAANIGLGQIDKGQAAEPPLITAGDDARVVSQFLHDDADEYSAREVLQVLLGP
jgi:nitronate monooxygenase